MSPRTGDEINTMLDLYDAVAVISDGSSTSFTSESGPVTSPSNADNDDGNDLIGDSSKHSTVDATPSNEKKTKKKKSRHHKKRATTTKTIDIAKSASTSSDGSSSEKSVTFGTAKVYEFYMIKGDHPDVTSGCPITIDWCGEESVVYDVIQHERKMRRRRRLQNSRRSRLDLKLTATERSKM